MTENPLTGELAREYRRLDSAIAAGVAVMVTALIGVVVALALGSDLIVWATGAALLAALPFLVLAGPRFDVVKDLHARFEPEGATS